MLLKNIKKSRTTAGTWTGKIFVVFYITFEEKKVKIKKPIPHDRRYLDKQNVCRFI